MRRLFVVLAGMMVAIGSLLVLPGGAGAVDGVASVRIAHLSPDTGGVDVYVDGVFLLGNVDFRTVSAYASVAAGPHRLELRPAGAAPTSPAALSAPVTLLADHAYTVAGVGPQAKLTGKIFDDDLSAPAAGRAKVRIINAAVGPGSVDVTLRGLPPVFPLTKFSTASTYEVVDPGQYDVDVLAAKSGRSLTAAPGVTFSAGLTYTLAAIGGAGQPLRLLAVVDAQAPTVTPIGGAATGGGGTAPRPVSEGSQLPETVALTLAGFVGVAVLVARRRTAHR